MQELKCTAGKIKMMCCSKQKPDTLQTLSSSEDNTGQNHETCTAQGSGEVSGFEISTLFFNADVNYFLVMRETSSS